MIDIRDHPEVIEIINNALTDGKILEVKNESWQKKVQTQEPNIVIVEINRIVRTKPKK